MGVEIGGAALEVAIGLAFVFFLLSLIVSACTEAFAWVKNLRAKTLEDGVRGMLGDVRIADDVLQHPLVQTDLSTPRRKKKKPSYLSSRNFALALVDVVKGHGDDPSGRSIKAIRSGIENLGRKSPLARQLTPLLAQGEKDIESFLGSLEHWFDDSMDRVSGWYKRHTQLVAIFAAVVVTVGLNADALRIAERLVNEPTVRASVVSQAEAADQTGEDVEDTVKELDALKLPLFWNSANDDVDWTTAVGWLITAIAISLGAPFWFDALGKLAHLRTSGKKPEPEK